jgi:hypothetical protein
MPSASYRNSTETQPGGGRGPTKGTARPHEGATFRKIFAGVIAQSKSSEAPLSWPQAKKPQPRFWAEGRLLVGAVTLFVKSMPATITAIMLESPT